MKKILLVLLIVLNIIIASCATRTFIVPETKRIQTDSFHIGELQEKTVGEIMIDKIDAIANIYNGFRAQYDYKVENHFIAFPTIKQGSLWIETARLGDNNYILSSTSQKIYLGPPINWDYCIVVSGDGIPVGDADCNGEGSYVRKWTNKPSDLFVREKVPKYGDNSFRQELIYNGKSKDSIKIQYREYKNDMARPAFYQDITYDLSESREIGFRGARIEVIEATNSFIKFIVKQKMN